MDRSGVNGIGYLYDRWVVRFDVVVILLASDNKDFRELFCLLLMDGKLWLTVFTKG